LPPSSLGAVEYSKSRAQFTFHPTPTITSISPSVGSELGSTVITVVGTNFNNLEQVRCKFGEVESLASFISASKLLCTSPKAVAVAVAASGGEREQLKLLVSLNNQQYSDSAAAAANFLYIKEPVVISIVPTVGSFLGGTPVTITGNNFLDPHNEMDVLCRFQSVTTTASVLSDTAIICTTPPSPNLEPISASVQISLNGGHEFTPVATVQFKYVSPLVISSVSPTSGPATGNYAVTIAISSDLDAEAEAEAVVCKFDEATSSVGIVNFDDKTVTCNVPPAPAGEGSSTIKISVNGGVDFSENSLNFAFTKEPEVSSVSPNSSHEGWETEITVVGTNFPLGGDMQCIFGEKDGASLSVVATVVTNTLATCVVPQVGNSMMAKSTVNLAVSASATSVPFSFKDSVTVTSISPSGGSVSGNTLATIVGTGFDDGVQYTCDFNFDGSGSGSGSGSSR